MPFASDLNIITEIENDIKDQLSRIGIIFRIFSRLKSSGSIKRKLEQKENEYRARNKKMQDAFGIRIACYFSDDVYIAQEVVKSLYEYDSQSVDSPREDIFGPTRCNIVYRLPQALSNNSHVIHSTELIDSTLEVQYRTILSEGWHEIEHDLRYKCKSDWIDHHDLSRSLNGVMATLETCDWSMIKMFDELSWRHYRERNWDQMIRTKMRLRFQSTGIPVEISDVLMSVDGLAKGIFRSDRSIFMNKLALSKLMLPITPANVIFIINRLFINNRDLTHHEGDILSEILNEELRDQ